MTNLVRLRAFALAWWVISVAAGAQTATPITSTDAADTFEVSVLLTDDAGETYFSTERVAFNPWFSAGKRTGDQAVEKFAVYKLDGHMVLPNYYPAPRLQFVLVLSGTLEIETTNGEKRIFTAGSMFLVTDTRKRGSRGHRSKVHGDEDVYTAVASLPEDADLSSLFSQ